MNNITFHYITLHYIITTKMSNSNMDQDLSRCFSDMIVLEDIFNKGFISQCNSDQLDSINLQINQNYQISVLMFDHFDSLVLCLRERLATSEPQRI